MLGSVPFELVLRPNTFIQTVDEGLALPIHNVYHLTRFGDLESLRHSRDSIIRILNIIDTFLCNYWFIFVIIVRIFCLSL